MKHALDPDVEYEIQRSETPVSVDGYKLGEPKWFACAECGARVLLTEEPSPGLDELQHEPDCSQRFARTEWWREHFLEGGE